MSSFENGWALTLIVFLPAVGAAAVLAIPKAQEEAQKWTALLFAGVSFALSVIVAFQFDYGAADRFQFEANVPWIAAIGANPSPRRRLALWINTSESFTTTPLSATIPIMLITLSA